MGKEEGPTERLLYLEQGVEMADTALDGFANGF